MASVTPPIPRLAAVFLAALVLAGAWLDLRPASAASAASPASDSSEKPWRVESLHFKGFDNLSPSAARRVMETKAPDFFSFKPAPLFDPLLLQADLVRLKRLYREDGFFRAEVTARVKRRARSRTVAIMITAHENDPVIIRKTSLEIPRGWERGYWHERLMRRMPLKVGMRFSLAEYRKAKQLLRRILDDQGRPLHKLQGQVRVYPQKLAAEVLFRLETGPRVVFGPTRISGLEDIDRAFVLKNKAYATGEVFSRRALAKTQRRLLDTGFFSSVTLEPEFDKIKDGRVPIHALLQERDMHSLRLGLGWGSEDQARLRIMQTNRNMFGWDETFTIEGKASAIYLGLVGRIRAPYVFNLRSDLLLSGGVEQKNNEGYENRRYFFSPALIFRMSDHWKWFGGYNVESDHMLDLKAAVPDPGREKNTHFISSVPLGVTFDSRDSALNPRRGDLFRLEVETALGAMGSEVAFVRPRVELSRVQPLGRLLGKGQWYLAGRVRAGVCLPLEGTDRIPMVRRFFPGGADSVRGYPYQRLGPLDSAGKPLGGEAMLVGNLELRFPIHGDLRGVVFTDMGNAFEDWEEFDSFSLRYTAGLGLRYDTPVGPLRLDWGFQLNPPEDAPIGRYEFYLSVGQAF